MDMDIGKLITEMSARHCGMTHPASNWTKEAAMVLWRWRRRALHPPRRFRVYADLIFPLPDPETTPVVRPAVPAREEGEKP